MAARGDQEEQGELEVAEAAARPLLKIQMEMVEMGVVEEQEVLEAVEVAEVEGPQSP